MPQTQLSVQELARRIGAELRGGGAGDISGVAPLETAGPLQIAFYANPRYRRELQATRAGAVIVSDEDAAQVPASAARLVAPQPYVAFAKASALFHDGLVVEPGIQAGALVDETAEVHPTAAISPGAYVGPNAAIGPRTTLHAGARRSEEHTSELQSQFQLVCRLLLEKKKKKMTDKRTKKKKRTDAQQTVKTTRN